MLQSILFVLGIIFPSNVFSQEYRIGDQWDRVSRFERPEYSDYFGSVGEIGSHATVFYIGEFKNRSFGITNAHVCPSQAKCENRFIEFFYHKNESGQSLKGVVSQVALVEQSLDLALIELDFKNKGSFSTRPTPLVFSDELLTENDQLVIMGYGLHLNEYGVLTIGDDQDCRVFDTTVRKISDPDQTNPLSYQVDSLPMGCDASHGDSGAPILDQQTGLVRGLLWTGRVPKHSSIARDSFRNLPLEFLWRELNFLVPADRIARRLDKFFLQL